MRTWDFFFPDVLPDVLGCPEPTVERAIQNAARDFCERSRIWRDDLPQILTAGLQAIYPIAYPEESEGVELIGATLDGVDIKLETADDNKPSQRRSPVATGTERVLTQDLVSVQLMPTPAADAIGRVLILTAILKPGEFASGLPDRFADKHRLAISNGALAKLLVANKAPWANPQLAKIKGDEFEAAIKRASSKAWKGNTNVPKRTITHYY